MVFIHVFFSLVTTSLALYSENSPVVKLTKENFDKLVLQSDEFWLVEFFAPWCGHCKSLAPEYEKAAKALKGIINLGAVDMTEDGDVGYPYKIAGFPTLKFFGDNKKFPKDYDSGRNSKDIVTFLLKQAESIATKRASSKASQNSEEAPKKPPKKEENPQKTEEAPKIEFDDSDVHVLTDKNFDSTVLASDELWYVEFYVPWCVHCETLAPKWAEAATELRGKVKFGKIDSTSEKLLTARFLINSFPSVRIFEPGNIVPLEYGSDYEAINLVGDAYNKLENLQPPKKIPQFVGPDQLSECESSVCVFCFLPHIYDSSADERNKYITQVNDVSKQFRAKPLKFFWAQAGDFYKFEEFLSVNAGYPRLAILSTSKNRKGSMRAAFTSTEIDSFLTRLLSGAVALDPYSNLPKIQSVEEWDGLDHEQEIEAEEI